VEARSGQIESTLGQVQGSLKTSREELEALRKWKGDAAKRMQTFRDMSAKLQKMVDAGKLGVRVRDGRLVMRLAAILVPETTGLTTENHLGHTARDRQFFANRPRRYQRIESLDPEVAGRGSYRTVLSHRHS